MKITIKKKESEVKQVFVKDVPPGYIFEITASGSRLVKALKLLSNKYVLLTYSSGMDWFEINDEMSWKDTPVRILGKLTEIIVEE